MALPAWMQENQKSSEKPDKILRGFYPQGDITKLCFLPVNRLMVLKGICDSFISTVIRKQEGRKDEGRGRIPEFQYESMKKIRKIGKPDTYFRTRIWAVGVLGLLLKGFASLYVFPEAQNQRNCPHLAPAWEFSKFVQAGGNSCFPGGRCCSCPLAPAFFFWDCVLFWLQRKEKKKCILKIKPQNISYFLRESCQYFHTVNDWKPKRALQLDDPPNLNILPTQTSESTTGTQEWHTGVYRYCY